MTTYFADASAWIALGLRNDRFHAHAFAAWSTARAHDHRVVTSDAVLAETYTRLRSRAGLHVARRFRDLVAASGNVHVVWTDKTHHDGAWKLFERFADQDVSFVDAVSFHVMRERRIRVAWSYDQDFERAGFEMLR